MPLRKELSKDDKAKIRAFYATVCGQMRRNATGKDFNIVIFLDYKGDPCNTKSKTHTLFLKARPSLKWFSLYKPSSDNENHIQHAKLIGEIVESRKAKTLRPTRNYKISWEKGVVSEYHS